MNENYIDILIQNLKQKNAILDSIIEENMKQKAILTGEDLDMDAFDATVDVKSALIERINMLDDGFESVFERVKEALASNQAAYKKEIAELQKLIREVTDKNMSIQKQELDNKGLAERQFSSSHQKVKQMKVSNQAASKYYNSMSKLNFVDPQFMDKKK